MARPVRDLTGQKFGILTVIEFAYCRNRNAYWVCQCECGQSKIIIRSSLVNGQDSCGCIGYQRIAKANRTHGMAASPEFAVWAGMIQRCTNPKTISYPRYGGRGIAVCDRWLHSFENFYEDMGQRPSNKHSIERDRGDGNYEPGNCRWATDTEQMRNRSNNKYFTINGVTKCLAEWAEVYGIPTNRLVKRVLRGWTIEKALTAPNQREKV